MTPLCSEVGKGRPVVGERQNRSHLRVLGFRLLLRGDDFRPPVFGPSIPKGEVDVTGTGSRVGTDA